jgi:hypothetical protein
MDCLGTSEFKGNYVGLRTKKGTNTVNIRSSLAPHENIPLLVGLYLWDGGSQTENIRNGDFEMFHDLNDKEFHDKFTNRSEFITIMYCKQLYKGDGNIAVLSN